MDINIYLDTCKEIRSLSSDNALANYFEVTRSSVSSWRHGVRLPDEVVCAKIADTLSVPRAKIIGEVFEKRAISKAAKSVWRDFAKVAVLIMCTLPVTSVFAAGRGTTSRNIVEKCILCQRRLMTGIVYLCRIGCYDAMPA